MTHVIGTIAMMDIPKIVSRFVYPSIRKRLIEILYYEYNLTQKEIARMLYLSQSAVSRYIQGNRGNFLDIKKAPKTNEQLKNLAREVLNNNYTKYEFEEKLLKITLAALGRGEICQFHNQIDSTIDPRECKVCINLFSPFADGK